MHSGVGRHPGAGDWAKVTYSGKLIDGTLFDGTSPGLPATLAVNGIIPGLSEALQLMHEGDRWQIVVPPALGFGPHGSANGAIPPEQALVFDVTLLSARRQADRRRRRRPAADYRHRGPGTKSGADDPSVNVADAFTLRTLSEWR